MANWYGIEGIEFHHINPWADFEITFEDVRDTAGVDVESTMWEQYTDEGFTSPDDQFVEYMQNNQDQVKDLIKLARGEDIQ